MASVSPFPILLTHHQRRELERRARAYTSPFRRVVRAEVILILLAASMVEAGLAGVRKDPTATLVEDNPEEHQRGRRRASM